MLAGCYAATGNPLFPLVRMNGYFILGDQAGVVLIAIPPSGLAYLVLRIAGRGVRRLLLRRRRSRTLTVGATGVLAATAAVTLALVVTGTRTAGAPLQQAGFPAARLKPLPVTAPGPLGSAVVVATPVIRG